ncbi:hypothetical protein Tco_0582003 [Tanacetum coccineum]
MGESIKKHEENSNMIKEIRASTNAAIRNQGESIKTLEIQIGQMSKVLQKRGFRSLPSSNEANSRDHVKSISTTVEADTNSIRRMRSSQYAVSTPQNSTLMYETRQMTILFPSRLNDYYCEEKKGSYGPVSAMPLSTYLNLGLGELAHTKLTVELADRIVKYPKGVAENILVAIELRRDQVDDLMPITEEGKIIEEVKARNDARPVNKKFGYPIVEDMDPYFDKGIGEVVVGKPFCEVSCMETKRFDGIITIRVNDESVTYQMVWSHPRFKRHTNVQCNKILPLLKIRRRKNGSNTCTLAMRWNGEEKLKKKSNLKTS